MEVITSHRPYRKPMTREEAVRVVRDGAGTHFRPEVAHAFLDALEGGDIKVQEEPDPLHDTFVTGILHDPWPSPEPFDPKRTAAA